MFTREPLQTITSFWQKSPCEKLSKEITMNNQLQSFVSRLFSGPWLSVKNETDSTQSSEYAEMLNSNERNEAENEIPVVATIDNILDDIGLTLFHIKLSLILGCLIMLDALEVSMLSVVSPVIKLEWNLSIWEEALIPLVTTCGIVVASSLWGWISDQYGRKRALVASSLCIFCFGLTSFLAINYYFLLVVLFLTGLGVNTTQVITMIEEFFPSLHRTKFSVLISLFWTIGFFISIITGSYINFLGFRGALALVCIPTAIFLMATPLVPESPRFCLASGDNEKALLILQQIAPKKKAAKFQDWRIYQNVDIPTERGNVMELFRHGYGKITCCLWLVWLGSMFSYYFTIFAATELATNKRFLESDQDELSTKNSYFTLAWMSLPEIAIILLTTLGSHFFSTKTLMLVSTSITVCLQAVIALFVGFNHKTTALVLFSLSRGCLSSQMVITFIYTSEVYPTTMRGTGMGIACSLGRLGMIVGPFIAQTVFQKTFFVGAIINVGSEMLVLVATVCLPFRSKSQMLE